MADSDISIDAMMQKEPHEGQELVDIIILTHQCVEKNVNAAMLKIEALAAISAPVARIRLEELAR